MQHMAATGLSGACICLFWWIIWIFFSSGFLQPVGRAWPENKKKIPQWIP